jgi:hypothetical protein
LWALLVLVSLLSFVVSIILTYNSLSEETHIFKGKFSSLKMF